MAWGLGEWGLGEWGLDSLAVVSAAPVAENRVRVTFNMAPSRTGLLTLDDGLRPQNYGFAALELPAGSRSVRAVLAELVAGDELSADVTLDRPLSPYPARYVVVVSNVVSESGFSLGPDREAEFDGLLTKRVPELPELATGARDVANPQTRSATLDPIPGVTLETLGSIPADDTGDYAFDEGDAYLRKRVWRRIVTRKNGFYHLKDYGLGVLDLLKKLSRRSALALLRQDAEDQIREEPDVEDVEVSLSVRTTPGGTILDFGVVVHASGRRSSFSFPFMLEAA